MTGRLGARSVTANGLRFGLLEAGSGPLALCLHGFPDSAHTWRHLLPVLSFFLKTPLADPVLAADDMAFLHLLWQDWSPGYGAGEDLHNVKQCLRDERNLAAAIGYYRSEEPGLYPSVADGPYAADQAALATAPSQPTLYLHGSRDGCIDLALVKDAERHLAPGSRMEVAEGAGHFLQVEQPAAVNARILAWVGA